MQLRIQDADGSTVSSHTLDAGDARCAVLEFNDISVGGNIDVENTKGQYIARDIVHQLRKAAMAQEMGSGIMISLTDGSGDQLVKHTICANAASFALEEIQCSEGFEPVPGSIDEKVGRFAIQDIIQALRKVARDAPPDIATAGDSISYPPELEERKESGCGAILSGIIMGLIIAFLTGGIIGGDDDLTSG